MTAGDSRWYMYFKYSVSEVDLDLKKGVARRTGDFSPSFLSFKLISFGYFQVII